MIGNVKNILFKTISTGFDHGPTVCCHQPEKETREWRGYSKQTQGVVKRQASKQTKDDCDDSKSDQQNA
jgi:hypothetical protein